MLFACTFILASGTPAFAYWTTTGSGSGLAAATTLGAGQRPTATVSGRDVTLSWSAANNAATYSVARSSVEPSGLIDRSRRIMHEQGVRDVMPPIGVPENGVAATTWTYNDTPHLINWVGAPRVRPAQRLPSPARTCR